MKTFLRGSLHKKKLHCKFKNQPVNQLINILSNNSPDEAQSVLLMEVGIQHVFFGIMSMGSNEIQQAAFYSCSKQEEDVLLYQVFEKHPELKSSFYQVIIAFQVAQNVLIPEQFYQENSTQTLLEILHGQTNNTKVISEQVEGFELYNVYQAPQVNFNLLNRNYSNAKYFHSYTAGIRNIRLLPDEIPQLIVDFKPSHITVYAIKHNQLQLVQIFPYESPADVVYYLARICFQLGILHQDVKIIVEGLIDESSAAYTNLLKYFTHVQFGQVPELIRFSENFNEHPAHFFSSIYKLATCVS